MRHRIWGDNLYAAGGLMQLTTKSSPSFIMQCRKCGALTRRHCLRQFSAAGDCEQGGRTTTTERDGAHTHYRHVLKEMMMIDLPTIAALKLSQFCLLILLS